MATRHPPMIDYEALARFRHEIRRFLTFSEAAARGTGIEPQQHQALLVLKGLRPGTDPTVGVLAERLQIRHHSAVELSRRLEARGLLLRTRSQRDAREVLLRLTARGERLLERLSISHRNELRTAAPHLIKALRRAIARNRPRLLYRPPRRVHPTAEGAPN